MNEMIKNVARPEQIVRIVLGIVLALLALIASPWPGWVRICLGIAAVAFFVTAFASY